MAGRRGTQYIPIAHNRVIEAGSGVTIANNYNNSYRGDRTESFVISATGSTGIASINGDSTPAQILTPGSIGTDFNIVTATGTTTFNMPDASTIARGVVTAGLQTFGGNKTFNNNLNVNGDTVLGDSSVDKLIVNGISESHPNGANVTSGSATNYSVTTGTTGSLTLDTGTTGAINIGTNSNAKIVSIGNATGTSSINLASGTSGIVATSTATTNNAVSIIDNALTTGKLLNLSSTSTAKLTGMAGLAIQLSGVLATASQTTYGIDVSNTHTGTTETNIGMRLAASGATNNYALITSGGNVGLGTASPIAQLHIAGNIARNITNVATTSVLTNGQGLIKVNNAATNITLTLPTPVGNSGLEFYIGRNTGSTGTITINPGGGQIEALAGTLGATTTLAAIGVLGGRVTFISNGVNWLRKQNG